MPVRLPIFPLGTVLVPGLMLPLHIFEERYRVLIEALIALPDGAVRQFGVVAIRSGSEAGQQRPVVYDVGCTAELRDVTPYSDGRFDVVTVGQDRFRLVGVDEEAGTPYLTGLVDLLPEEPGGAEDEVAAAHAEVVRQFADYRRRLQVEAGDLPDDPRVVSYLVSAAMVLDLPQRQALLEQESVASRLRAEIALLRRERALVQAFGALPAVDLPGAAPHSN